MFAISFYTRFLFHSTHVCYFFHMINIIFLHIFAIFLLGRGLSLSLLPVINTLYCSNFIFFSFVCISTHHISFSFSIYPNIISFNLFLRRFYINSTGYIQINFPFHEFHHRSCFLDFSLPFLSLFLFFFQ